MLFRSLEPLLLALEESYLGYTINGQNVAGGAYADDLVLTSNNHTDMQKMFDMVTQYYEFFGLEMSISDTKDKTAYTHNREHAGVSKSIKYLNKDISWLKQSESYRYLGVHINLDLN